MEMETTTENQQASKKKTNIATVLKIGIDGPGFRSNTGFPTVTQVTQSYLKFT